MNEVLLEDFDWQISIECPNTVSVLHNNELYFLDTILEITRHYNSINGPAVELKHINAGKTFTISPFVISTPRGIRVFKD